MDAEKNKKLQQYATILSEQAKDAEKGGKSEDAIKLYLKLVDVFLVLASEAPDHNTWLQYIRQAEAYQTRIKSLVPGQLAPSDITNRIPPAPDERTVQNTAPRREFSSQENIPQIQNVNQSASKPGTLNKILKPFQRGDIEDQGQPIPSAGQNKPPTSVPTGQRPQATGPQPFQTQTTTKPSDDKGPVPHELYERALSENRILHERMQSIVKETDEKIAFLESRSRELEERVAMMVPRVDYESLREEFQNTVPKPEYERLKTELAGTVPISHYDQILDRISGMVPREIYAASQKRVLELEDHLSRSVPFNVIDELANEVSFMAIVAEVPPMIGDGEKKEGEDDLEILSTESKSE